MGKVSRVITAKNSKKLSVKQQNQKRSSKGVHKPHSQQHKSNHGSSSSSSSKEDRLPTEKPKRAFPTRVQKPKLPVKTPKIPAPQYVRPVDDEDEVFDGEADMDMDPKFLLSMESDRLEHVPTRKKINAEKRKQEQDEKRKKEESEKALERERELDEEDASTIEGSYERHYFEEKEREENEKKQELLANKAKDNSTVSKFKRKRASTEEEEANKKKQKEIERQLRGEDGSDDESESESAVAKEAAEEEPKSKKQRKAEAALEKRMNKKLLKKKQQEEEEEQEEDDDVDDETRKRKLTALEQLIMKDPMLKMQRFREKQEIVAILATEVLANPVLNIKRMTDLHHLCSDIDDNVKQIALLSEAALFKDLIPAYRINMDLLNDAQGTRLSKEVRELHHFEVGIVKAYQQFLMLATKHVKKYASQLQIACVKSLCELLVAHPHFNYTQLIIDSLVPLMNSNYSRRNESKIHRRKEKVSILVFEHVCKLFANDSTQGEVSLDVVEVIANFIMKRQYKVSTRLIDCFLYLPLKTMLTDKTLPTSIQSKSKIKSKKKGKKAKDMNSDEAISRDFAESNAKVSQSHIKHVQSDILRNIIVIYVRALKNATFQMAEGDDSSKRLNEPNVVFCSLAGLAKFAHLMNIDLLYDLLDYIRTILNATDDDIDGNTVNDKVLELRVDIVLQSLITASKLMEGLGAAIDIDPRDFYSQLYAVIPRVFHSLMDTPDVDHQEEDEYHDRVLRLFVDAFHKLLIVPNLTHSGRLPMGRVCAFVKRVCGYCATFISPQYIQMTVACIKLCTELMRKYPQMIQLMETPGDEEGSIGGLGGVFNANSDDPDSANANGSVLWDIYNIGLHYHYHPQIRTQVNDFLRLGQKYVEKEFKSNDYQELLDKYNPYTMDGGRNSGIRFAPPVRAPEVPLIERRFEKLQARLNSDKVTNKLKQKIPEAVYLTPSIYASTKASSFFRRGFENLKANKVTLKEVLQIRP